MSREQRDAVDALVRRGSQGFQPVPVEQMRQNFAALMGMFPVPTDVTKTPTVLGERPAVVVEPQEETHPGTVLYFHGGSFTLGSPDTAMGLTAGLVNRTRIRAISLD